ncbi:MAG TPA: TonB-dependent receptor [Gemmatimonas sp.]|uniref:SusC/RagA family TonB-linked outer membrane protein n=1 Tax=Gemmatimonas sp. TaxID=1962908 RepID=UPI002ED8385C
MRSTQRLGTALLAAFVLSAHPIAAQTTTTGRIAGRVMSDAAVPLANAGVGVVGSQLGTRTDADGRYRLTNLPPGRYILRAALIGYNARVDTVVVTAGQETVANFALKVVSVTLDQMVVVGYGTQRRSDITGSVTSVQPNTDRTPITSLEQTLQGTAPGVQVTQASSAPGGGMSIRIRGGSSVNGNNEPLYVIDGFPVENDFSTSSGLDGGREATTPANPLAALNPSDIQSIEILKDASATAIYGSRGANGVVLITTKRGEGAKPKIAIDLFQGQQVVAKRYDLLDATQFGEFANAWAETQNLPKPYANPSSLGVGTDWQDLIFRQAAIRNAQISISGGSTARNATRYAISGGVFQQDGVVDNSDFKRISLRGNIDQMIGDKLKVGSNVLLSRVNSSQIPTDGSLNAGAGAVGAALQYPSIMTPYRADGTYTLLGTDFPQALLDLGIAAGNVPNPVASAIAVNDKLFDTRILANVAGEYKILKGLVWRSTVGTDLSFRGRDTYYPRTTLQGFGQNGRAIRSTTDNTSFLNENTLAWNGNIGSQHVFSTLAGYSRQKLNSTRGDMRNSNFVSDITGFENIGAGSQAGGPTVSSGRSQWTLASYFGRVNYTLLDRYLFSASARRDGSSRFGANNRWGVFPAGAVSWRLSEEPFMRRLSLIDNLKLRYTYGVVGNPSISPYQSLTRLTPQQYTFNGQLAPGYYPAAIGNPDLSWESTTQHDVGLDLTALKGRVDFVFDWYNKRTDDLLLQIDLPSEVGYQNAFVNAGSIENKGIEAGITLKLLEGGARAGGISWSTTFNYTRNRNKVLSLGGVDRIFASQRTSSDINATSSVVQVGQPIGAFFGFPTGDLFRDSTSLLAWRAKTRFASGTVPGLGNRMYIDINGDSLIDANDRTIIGDPNPDYVIGWTNNVSWKGFEFSALFDGSYGAQILNLNNMRLNGASPALNVTRDRFLDAWSPTNPDGKYQRIGAGAGFLNADITQELLEDGSYFRLRTITISRQIPQRWLRQQNLSARVYVTGQNVKTWSKYTGFNPDVSSISVGNLNRGVDVGAYPLARTWTFGMNINY